MGLFSFFSQKKELKDHMWRANLYRKQEKYKESIQAYVQAVKIDPSLLEAQRNLGWLYRRLEHPVQSIRHYKTSKVIIKKDI